MRAKPPRPQPSEKVLDYDDGDPYSCMAAGREEERLQQKLLQQVFECFGHSESVLDGLAQRDLAGVQTALYDIWDGNGVASPSKELSAWAAAQAARLGNRSLLEYDRS
ncbi:MAG: hypothetical protein U0931_28315 [Vulcanimicrobiota bacterium]